MAALCSHGALSAPCCTHQQRLARAVPSTPVLGGLTPASTHPQHAHVVARSHSRGGVDVACRALAIDAPPAAALTKQRVGPQLGWPSMLEEDFVMGSLLGSGAYGVVHSATHKRTGAEYAIKVLRKGGPRTRVADTLARVSREVEVLEALGECRQVARLGAKYETARFVYLVIERCYGPSMMQVMKDPTRLSEGQVCCLIYECLQVLKACHDQRILHGDVKAANFMMAKPLEDVPICDLSGMPDPVLKAVDFGCSRYLAPGEHLRELVGSPAYTAPEVHLGMYELPSDIWSMGMTFYQLVTGRLPFWPDYRSLERCSWEQLTSLVLRKEVTYDDERWAQLSPEAQHLCAAMLERDPATRVTATEALTHPWFAKFSCLPTSGASVFTNNIVPIGAPASAAAAARAASAATAPVAV